MQLQALPFNLASLRAAYGAGIRVQDVMGEALRRTRQVGDPGIFLHLAGEDDLIETASRLGPFDPEEKPLWGVPFAVKDNVDVAGMPTTAGCPAFAYAAGQDAFVVARLRAAGAIPVGKTNLDQFATGLVGARTPFPVPRNAVDPQLVPGGSSSGSAIAVAHGLVTFALGTDTAGSGRVPAAFNNIVGLKPSLGALSATGVVPACRTLDTVSVFALTVEDAFAGFSAMAGFDAGDAFSRRLPAPAMAAPPERFAVGVPDAASRDFAGDDVQRAAFDGALVDLEALGAEIRPLDFEAFFAVAQLLYEGPWVAERYAAVRALIENDPDAIHSLTRAIVGAARKYSAADTFDALYRLADLKRALEPVLNAVDMLCVPSVPRYCTTAELEADPLGPNAMLGTYTNFVNLLDLCGMAVPTRRRADGLPGSVTLLSRHGRDGEIAAVASVLHRMSAPGLGATVWDIPEPDSVAPVLAGNDEIALAMVGAHMRGLSLNGELIARKARFLCEAKTAPEYRLFALAGGPPSRPGMTRDADGAPIALEVWAMPSAEFGEFMSGIPQPLCIGTVNLADGSKVKGFLCEPAGLVGAEDVTAFGGWRAYLASR